MSFSVEEKSDVIGIIATIKNLVTRCILLGLTEVELNYIQSSLDYLVEIIDDCIKIEDSKEEEV